MNHSYAFTGKLQRFTGAGGWHYVALSKRLASTLRTQYRPNHGGWGSLRVLVSVGKTTWKTSIFWNKEVSYWLFVKAAVRKQEKLKAGNMVRGLLTLLNV